MSIREDIRAACDEIGSMLLVKNSMYGNSALDPIRIFSRASPAEQLKIRIDDKLSRIYNNIGYDNEDTISDLIGYLILYKIAVESESARAATIPPDAPIPYIPSSNGWSPR